MELTNSAPAGDWRPDSWQSFPARQQPNYRDRAALDAAVAQLSRLPPVVVSWEVERLRAEFAAAQRGERFLLQGGDCAESFDDCDSGSIAQRLKILLQMSLVLVHGLKRPIIRVGRMAGQYAKPRSADTETRDGVTLPSYRGDIVNRPEFTAEAREPDPTLLLRGYERAALTLNFIRALIDGGFADLHHPEYWDLGFVGHSPFRVEYERIVASVADGLEFFETISAKEVHQSLRTDFYTSHEALVLHYEQAQTRFIARQDRWYNLSTHMPWIGMRTAEIGGAHVEYCRGIANPVGVKVGTAMDIDWLQRLVTTLNPENIPGKLALSTASARGTSSRHCPERSKRCAPPGTKCCGSAIPCTATPRTRRAASRPVASRTSCGSSSRRSRSITRWVRVSAACISSSPVRTSPNARGVRVASQTRICSALTAPRWIRG